MTDPKGHQCPECGAPRGADNTPSCSCTQRASDALRDARTAEQAAAEDFDPLRIRPYVALEGPQRGALEGPQGGALEGAGSEPAAPPPLPAVEATMPLRALGPEVPSADDLHLFESGGPEDTYDEGDDAANGARRRRRTVLLGVGGAFVSVLAAAGLASGLFSYEAPSRDTALPDDVRASVPDAPPSEASESPPENATSVRPPAPPVPTTSASPSLSPSPSATSASPSPSRSAEPTRTPPTATASGSMGATDTRGTTPPVLRRGSEGPEVTELELRLTQLGLYTRQASGHFNEGVEDAVSRYQWARGIQGDELGVYGSATRSRLESETSQP